MHTYIFFLSFLLFFILYFFIDVAWSRTKKKGLGHWSKPVTRLPLLHACVNHSRMHAIVAGELKHLPGKVEGDDAHDWRFSLGGEETSHDWGGACERWPQEHDGGKEGYLLARHSPLFLLIFTGSPCSGFLLRVPSVMRWDSYFNGGLLYAHRMEELLGLVQLRDEGEDDGDGDGGLNPGDGGSSPAFFLFLLVSVFPPFIPSFCFLRPLPLFFLCLFVCFVPLQCCSWLFS